MRQLALWMLCLGILSGAPGLPIAPAETLRQATSLEQRLQRTDPAYLANQARLRGDARRGALLFYKSPAACATCHSSGEEASPLGPDLARLGKISDTHVVESLLFPSKSIREGYETQRVLTVDGRILSGLVAEKDDRQLTLRTATNLQDETVIDRADVEAISASEKSMMPDGLIASLGEQRDFLDLALYVMQVAEGGQERARQLQPSAEQLRVEDDTANLDHAGIIKQMRSRDFDAGKAIYHSYCFNCHGEDGNTPSLPTARAFGTQKMRFGADPYRMFLTLSHGNGLMAPMTHLTPRQRYQVIHYIRQQFMKSSNPAYKEIDKTYLASLPKGTRDGTEIQIEPRDFGVALASQLGREYSSVLTLPLGEVTISYDLHTMDQAELWRGGFLDLSETQHQRDRGEGTAMPAGDVLEGLAGWRWGHDETLDYPTEKLLPRGPMPSRWMDYHGYYRHGQRVVLSYAIDQREILETVRAVDSRTVVHTLEIAAGDPLVLCVAEARNPREYVTRFQASGERKPHRSSVPVDDAIAILEEVAPSSTSDGAEFAGRCAVAVTGDTSGFQWDGEQVNRTVLRIPASSESQTIAVVRSQIGNEQHLSDFRSLVNRLRGQTVESPGALTHGGSALWPERVETTGYLGLQQGGYQLDTLTLPDQTPWNTWFRTSSLDFFPDGRMVVTTYGGDVWIVSGIDDDLLEMRWKRFAAGLYEPFGVKVVDEKIYVTCKDRLVRLHDLNNDGEADYYESFSADDDVSVNFHAFNFDLQVDPEGNFYYSKSGHGADSELPGAVVKVSSDGATREIFSTGFRTPNGMGMLPDGRPTVSDNQGQWTPASKISLARPGGFYGWVQTYSIPGMWQPGGGTIDIDKVVPPKTFDPPIVWMPQEFDNSSGGQLFVDDPRWGPLSGHLLHTSFGKGWMSYLMMQEVGELTQAAIIKLPYDFRTGIMRARVNPADGQVYATGLQGWNGGGRAGLLEGGIQRLRYTGKTHPIVEDCQVTPQGLRIRFNFELASSAAEVDAYRGEQWDYLWSRNYGSDQYLPGTDEKGVESLQIRSVELSDDRREVRLNVSNLKPVDQLHLILRVHDTEGELFEEEIYWTIHGVPAQDAD